MVETLSDEVVKLWNTRLMKELDSPWFKLQIEKIHEDLAKAAIKDYLKRQKEWSLSNEALNDYANGRTATKYWITLKIS